MCPDLSDLARGRLSLAPLGRPGLLGRCCKQHMSGSEKKQAAQMFFWLVSRLREHTKTNSWLQLVPADADTRNVQHPHSYHCPIL
jgi:hypothetical protein